MRRETSIAKTRMHVVEVRNAELLATIATEAEQLGIKNAAIVTLIGAADSFTMSTMPAHDATADVVTDYPLPAEMTATGEIIEATVHVHAVIAVIAVREATARLPGTCIVR